MGTAITTRRNQPDQPPTPLPAMRGIAGILGPYRELQRVDGTLRIGSLPPKEVTKKLALEAQRALEPYKRAATAEDVISLMARIRLHYPDWERHNESEARLVAQDWIEDLAGYPIGLLVEACARWRQSSAKHAPTPGQLLSTVNGLGGALDDLKQAQHSIALTLEWYAAAESATVFEARRQRVAQLARDLALTEELAAKWEKLENDRYASRAGSAAYDEARQKYRFETTARSYRSEAERLAHELQRAQESLVLFEKAVADRLLSEQ